MRRKKSYQNDPVLSLIVEVINLKHKHVTQNENTWLQSILIERKLVCRKCGKSTLINPDTYELTGELHIGICPNADDPLPPSYCAEQARLTKLAVKMGHTITNYSFLDPEPKVLTHCKTCRAIITQDVPIEQCVGATPEMLQLKQLCADLGILL